MTDVSRLKQSNADMRNSIIKAMQICEGGIQHGHIAGLARVHVNAALAILENALKRVAHAD